MAFTRKLHLVGCMIVAGVVAFTAMPRRANAIPAFARKYGTSCVTCHTIYPKLTPFGEAFRHNGFRFPGLDSDMVKLTPVSMGSDSFKKVFPKAVWPGTLPGSVPLSVGFNGSLVLHPQTSSSLAQADNGAEVVGDNLVEEGHLWAGGSFDDAITFFGEMTVGSQGISIERAFVSFDDLFGPDHAANLLVGKSWNNLTSFGPHSTYLGDTLVPGVSATALFGATNGIWNLTDNFSTVELSGVFGGMVDYSVGVSAGANVEVRTPQNVYAHLGVKIGGMRMDGEEKSSVPDATKPWAEKALTLSGFVYHSSSRFTIPDPASTVMMPLPDLVRDDDANVFGFLARGQWMSLELDAGINFETHNNPGAVDGKANVTTVYDELSYVVYPWLVPAVRFEHTILSPDGGTSVSDTRLTLGVAALVRPNIKLILAGHLETASGLPPGGWSAAGGAAFTTDPSGSVSLEIESITLGMAFAY